MDKEIANVGIILSGGTGTRFSPDKPKQYYELLGREVIAYSVEAFQKARKIDKLLVVVDEQGLNALHIQQTYGLEVIPGGKTRNWSFRKAIDYIKMHYPHCQKLIENNAACPMITPELIDSFMDILDTHDYVNTAYKITDSLGAYEGRVADRENYYLIQSPDAYRFALLEKYFDPDSPLSHPAHQLPLECREYRYFGFDRNIKITYPLDIEVAEVYLKHRNPS